MTRISLIHRRWLSTAALIFTVSLPIDLLAGGPLLLSPDGGPRVWPTALPVELNLDEGTLGEITDTVALVEHAVAQWNSVTTATLKLEIGEGLGSDFEDLSSRKFDSIITKRDGKNPIIFDSRGETFETMFGGQSNVLAVAGPSLLSEDGMIRKGYAIFNGAETTPQDAEMFKAVVTHEVGHLLNLDHSQVNALWIGRSHPGFSGRPSETDATTMFPVLIQSDVVPHPMATLHVDDRAAFSRLYPTPAFAALPAIRGDVFDFDGVTPLQGLNVIARNINNPFLDAYSAVSGGLVPSAADANLASGRGAFELRGLTPGQPYVVYIEEVARIFVEGSSLGPLDPPTDVDTTRVAGFLEFWNNESESGRDPPDDPFQLSPVTLAVGESRADVDIIFNGVLARPEQIEPQVGGYESSHAVTVMGVNFTDTLAVSLEGRRNSRLAALMQIDRNTLEGVVPAGLIPGEYQVRVVTGKGISSPGGISFRVTEPLPFVRTLNLDVVENDRNRLLSVTGDNLLGTVVGRLVGTGLPGVDLAVAERVSASRVVLSVPAGSLPGSYRVAVDNTAGTSPLSEPVLEVVELAPSLSGTVEPPSGKNSRPTEIRILGENLSGTSEVTLTQEAIVVSLTIVSTSLTEVVATVPGGLETGAYAVTLTNSAGTSSGGTFTVKKSGGGGGCGAAWPGTPGVPSNFPFLLFTVLTLVALRSLRPVASVGT